MTRIKVKRLANPRRAKVTRRANAKRKTRRALTPRQIKFFGTPAQKAALKRSRAAKRSAAKRKSNPVRRKRSHNPELILTMGALNPRRSKPMAKAKKRKKISKAARTVNPRRRRKANRRRRVVVTRNPRRRTRKQNRRRNTRVVVVQPRHNRRRSRRNPSLFGSSITSKEGLKMIGGGLAGVVAAKFIPTLIPSSMSGITSSSAGRTVATGAAAVLAGYLAGKWDAKLGDAVLFGGLMQTASVALNAFLPSVYGSLGIGLGDFVPGKFAVPQNPMRQLPAGSMGAPAHLPSASGAKVSATRLASAYSPAY